MSKTKNQEDPRTGDGDRVSELRRIARLLEIMVRLDLESMKGSRSQNEIISMLDSAGCGQSEIADLLRTTANTVNVSLYKAKRKARKK
jgi:DNA-directed RNA polymerase specialized sigma24 family protein